MTSYWGRTPDGVVVRPWDRFLPSLRGGGLPSLVRWVLMAYAFAITVWVALATILVLFVLAPAVRAVRPREQ